MAYSTNSNFIDLNFAALSVVRARSAGQPKWLVRLAALLALCAARRNVKCCVLGYVLRVQAMLYTSSVYFKSTVVLPVTPHMGACVADLLH